jgi:hypothetical protein
MTCSSSVGLAFFRYGSSVDALAAVRILGCADAKR